jgi:hypothetical protein
MYTPCNTPNNKVSSISVCRLAGELLAQTHFRERESTGNYSQMQKTLHKQQVSDIKKWTQTIQDLWNTCLKYGFYFLHTSTYPRTITIDCFVLDSGRTLVRSEYGYSKGSPNTNS